jgi:ABC-type lipoprotein release transport system permease subunit
MSAIWFRLRTELRARWPGLIAVALLAGAAGGVALVAVAGARRTASAYTRLEAATNAYDVAVNPDLGTGSKVTRRSVARLPQVAQVGRLDGVVVATTRLQHRRDARLIDRTITLASDGRAGVTLARPNVTAGRLPDPRHPDEAFIDQVTAHRQHLGVGSVLRGLGLRSFDEATELFRMPFSQGAAAIRHGRIGRKLALRVVGVGEVPDQIVVDQGFNDGNVLLSRAFRRAHPELQVPFFGLFVRLHGGVHQIAEFRRAVQRIAPGEAIAFQTKPANESKFDRAVQPYVGALTIFAIVVALTGVLLVGQALARQSFVSGADTPTLVALGASRDQLFLVGMLRAALVAVGAMVAALAIAVVASPLMPIGPARSAEPDPGIAFDAMAIGVGALVLGLVVMLLAAWPSWRDARARQGAELDGAMRTSRIARALASSGAPVPMAAGVRMALEPGRGRSALPVRTTILALGLAITVVLGAIGVVTSIDHLVDTPRLFGWNWDVQVNASDTDAAANRALHADLDRMLDRSPAVRRWSTATLSDVQLQGVGGVPTVGIDTARRAVVPTIVSGRLPRRTDEIALGLRTLRSLGADLGSTVRARANDGRTRRLLVVGQVVLPGVGVYPGSDKTALGEGAVVTDPALRALGPDFKRADYVIDFAPSATAAARTKLLRSMSERVPADVANTTFEVGTLRRPSDIISYEGVRDTPLVLAGVLALLALASVAHALVTAVRRRRRDLALLETLGFTRRQVSSCIAWQATTVGVASLLIGVPLGIALGRVSWTILADDLGTVAEPITSVVVVLLAVPIVLALVNLVAFVPARAAARTRPAIVLRSE